MSEDRAKDFDWPCDKRKAHGPHQGTKTTPKYPGGYSVVCPGVKAHPNTQIGRQ